MPKVVQFFEKNVVSGGESRDIGRLIDRLIRGKFKKKKKKRIRNEVLENIYVSTYSASSSSDLCDVNTPAKNLLSSTSSVVFMVFAFVLECWLSSSSPESRSLYIRPREATLQGCDEKYVIIFAKITRVPSRINRSIVF